MATEVKATAEWPEGKFTIFLAGAIDNGAAKSWQKYVVKHLAAYDVVLLNPRRDDWDSSWEQSIENPQFREQVTWEQAGMREADFRIFVMLNDSKAPITLMELGEHVKEPGAVCCEPEYYRKGNVDITCSLNGMPVFESLNKLIVHLQTILDEKGLRLPGNSKTASVAIKPIENLSIEDGDYAALDELKSALQFPLTLYRAISVPYERQLDTDHVGECWAYEEKFAVAYDGDPRWKPYVLRGVVDEDAVDWDATFFTNVEMHWSETEIRLKPGAKVELTGIRRVDEDEWSEPAQRMVTAAVAHHKFPSWETYFRSKGSDLFNIKPGWQEEYGDDVEIAEADYSEKYEGQTDYLNSLQFPLTVYRAIDAPLDRIDFNRVGVYWAVDPNGADAYGGVHTFAKNLNILTAQILDPTDVDWSATIDANLLNEYEYEIRVMPGTELKLLEIETMKGTVKQDRMVTANSGVNAVTIKTAAIDGWLNRISAGSYQGEFEGRQVEIYRAVYRGPQGGSPYRWTLKVDGQPVDDSLVSLRRAIQVLKEKYAANPETSEVVVEEPITVIAADYEEMFKALIAECPSIQGKVKQEIAWAKRALKKLNRITWWLRWYRIALADWLVYHWRTETGETELSEEKRKRIEDLAKKYWREGEVRSGSAQIFSHFDPHFNPNTDPTWKHEQGFFEHIYGIPYTPIQAYDLQFQTIADASRALYRLENEFKEQAKGTLTPQSEDSIFLDFHNGWAWWLLPRASCDDEANAMGHCGNSPDADRTDMSILSLRQKKKVGNKDVWEPHLTFILHRLGEGTDSGTLGEMKGKGNDKPVQKYHPYIVALLKDERIKGIDGGGYKPENNFSPKDLTEEERQEIREVNPAALMTLKQYYKEYGLDDVCAARVAAVLGIPNEQTYDGFVVRRWDSEADFIKDCGDRDAKKLLAYVEDGNLELFRDELIDPVDEEDVYKGIALFIKSEFPDAEIDPDSEDVASAVGKWLDTVRVTDEASPLRSKLETAYIAAWNAERPPNKWEDPIKSVQEILNQSIDDSTNETSTGLGWDPDGYIQTIPDDIAVEDAIDNRGGDYDKPSISPSISVDKEVARTELRKTFDPEIFEPALELARRKQMEERGQHRLFKRPETDEEAEREGFRVSRLLRRRKNAASDEVERAEANKFEDENAFLNHHYTGSVPSNAYSGKEMFSWQKLEKYPKLLKKVKLKDGTEVELRQEGTENRYTYWNLEDYERTGDGHRRDENGDLVYMTPEEIAEKGYPQFDTAIMAFNDKGECVGQASDEWGADLVAVREDYQGKGLGTILLTEFRRQYKNVRQMGQMTGAGRSLAKSYYRSLTGKGRTPEYDPGEDPQYLALRAVWRFLGNLAWENWDKFTPEQAKQLHKFEEESHQDDPQDAKDLLRRLKAWVKQQGEDLFGKHALKALDNHSKTAAMETAPPITETPQFKTWFQGSKVVDDNHQPLLVWHGTDVKFEGDFESNLEGNEFTAFFTAFFTEDKELAGSYGSNLYQAYLVIRKPAPDRAVFDAARAAGLDEDFLQDEYPGIILNADDGIVRILKERGYDGWIGMDSASAEDFHRIDDAMTYVVFSPAQIRRVTAKTAAGAATSSRDQALLDRLKREGHPSGQLRLAYDDLLPPTTKLIHFTTEEAAISIAEHGFTQGVSRWEILVNSMLYEPTGRPGYNFAFLYGSKDARAFAKSATAAVVFENTGVVVEHLGDHEQQVIFWGPEVRGPFRVVLLNHAKTDGQFAEGRRTTAALKDASITGSRDFKAWYHGTSKANAKKALAAGELRPGMDRNSGGEAPQPGAVYITSDRVIAEHYAEGPEDTTDGGTVLKVQVEPGAQLLPDEDSIGELLEGGELNGNDHYFGEVLDLFWTIYGGDPSFPHKHEAVRDIANDRMRRPMFFNALKATARALREQRPEIADQIIEESGKAAHVGPVKVLGVAGQKKKALSADFKVRKDKKNKTLWVDFSEPEAGLSDQELAEILAEYDAADYKVEFRSVMDDGSWPDYKVIKRAALGSSITRVPKALEGLAAEARKCSTFEEFSQDFHRDIKHGQYWHLTDNPDFQIDLSKGPRDMSSMADGAMDAGKLMITSHLENWHAYYNYDREGKKRVSRPYVALIDMSQVPRNAYHQVSRGFGNEFWVEDPSQARVVKVYPLQSALAKSRYYSQTMAKYFSSDADLKHLWEVARGEVGSGAKVAASVILYHGTSEPSWAEEMEEETRLYLAKDYENAESYAYEAAAHDEENRLSPQPVVYSIPLSKLHGYDLQPDWGAGSVAEGMTWQQSLREIGSICVQGDLRKLKSQFKKIPVEIANDGMAWNPESGRYVPKVASAPPPQSIIAVAQQMLDAVKPEQAGDSKVVDGYWIETHTLGCRNAADEAEETWWDGLFEFYDEYSKDGISTVLGDPGDGKFATVTPQRKKTAYLSPKEAELTIVTDQGSHPRATVLLDLGIPNFSAFALTFPIDGLPGPDLAAYMEDAFEAMLDEVAAFMISLKYEDSEILTIFDLARKCYRSIAFKDASDATMPDLDPHVRMYEGHFEIPPEFVDQTYAKVITAAVEEAPVTDVTETPEFKRWFGHSKVVDAHGRPQVMYHATQTPDIEEFRPYTHFGTQQAANDRHSNLTEFYDHVMKNPARSQGANIMPVYLSVQNPLRLPDLAGIDDYGKPMDHEPEDDFDSSGDERSARTWEGEEAIGLTLLEQGIFDIDEFEQCRDNRDALKLLGEKGYDGIVYTNVVEDPGNDSWIVFHPNQVKSAIGNNGQFSPESKSITASARLPYLTKPVPVATETYYTEGGCYDLAQALHEEFGLPVYGVFNDEGAITHAFVADPVSKRGFDITGDFPLSDEEMIRPAGVSDVSQSEVGLSDARQTVREYFSEPASITAAKSVKRTPTTRHIELTKLNPKSPNSPARIIELYKNRTLRNAPRPHYVVVYDVLGRGVGVIPLAKNWEQRLLKRL